jgi:hypothetical protein
MADDKLVKLVRGLNKQTLAGKIAWESTDRVGVFEVSYPNYSIRISVKEKETSEDIWITIINDLGDTVESFSDVTISSSLPNSYRVMSNIYAEARRIAMGVNAALDEILGDMGLYDDEEEDIPF